MSATKVVVIEDEPDILELIEYNLRREVSTSQRRPAAVPVLP